MHYRKSAGFSKIAFVLITCSILIGGVVAAVLFGYGYVGIKQPAQQVMLVANVCDQKIVDEYNAIFDDITKQSTKLTDLEKSITARSGYDKDSTCLYMLTQKNILSGKLIVAGNYLTSLKANVKQGMYVNTSVHGLGSIAQLDNTIKNFQTTQTVGAGGEG